MKNKIKRFYYSTGGKIILFLICLIAIAGLTASLLAEVLILENHYSVYTSTEQQIFADRIENEMYLDGMQILHCLRTPDVSKVQTLPEFRDTNLIYEVRNEKGKVIAASETTDSMEGDLIRTYTYNVVLTDGQITGVDLAEIVSDGEIIYESEEIQEPEELRESEKVSASKKKPTIKNATYTVSMALKKNLPINDYYRYTRDKIHLLYVVRDWIPVVGILSLLVGFISYIFLLLGAGHVEEQEELVPDLLFGIPWDLMAAIWAFAAMGDLGLLINFTLTDYLAAGIMLLVTALIIIPCFLWLSICLASRLKQHTVWSTSLLRKLCLLTKVFLRLILYPIRKYFRLLLQLILNLPLLWRTVLCLAVLSILEFSGIVLNRWYPENLLILWFLEKMVLVPLILCAVLNLRRLEKGAQALAEGNLSYHTESELLLPGIRQSADNLNQIGVGMAKAVEERLKSERMKTELITNVSHDIKTPLTSVINYANLIGEEAENSERVKEYSEVLVRQSDRLKRLLEDLVEASKAATGNLDVDLLPCSAAVFLDQIAGEYQEKVEKAGLSIIRKLPEKELIIFADGRRMWRLFSNLMNNICKYSLPGSRVYLTLEEQNGKAVFSFKNTSKEPLNLSEEELFERFTRGDSSRHTDGSGLGLSIAKSMADLQGGSLRLMTDGDLFKAVAEFPLKDT
ncbi:MAG: HAMP domain-containing histidine kinase [Lachnospiraceae bacterium]|nr:HAMP domain-containing histidine kinase [Lachnospiraceae bacterium]